MEHASRGRRSGNKGVGARWRGRFRIFSARHCSRTKVSHAENSGMTMLFFSLEVAPMSEGDSFTGSGAAARGGGCLGGLFCGFVADAVAVCFEGCCGSMCWPVDRPATHAAAGAAARGVRGDWGILLRLDWEPLRERTLDHRSGQTRMPPQERRHEEVFGLGDSFAVGLGAVAGADA